MIDKLADNLRSCGFELYPKSLRKLHEGLSVFVAAKPGQKMIGFSGAVGNLPFKSAVTVDPETALYKPDWDQYLFLKDYPGMAPSACRKKSSFGTGDRLGLVTAAHLQADSNYDIFPVIAQQSPRELIKTNRTFKSVLLDAFVAVLETGWARGYGADADHIKDIEYLVEGADAGYSMYTLDVSDFLKDPDQTPVSSLSQDSRNIIAELSNKSAAGYSLSENELTRSALIYQSSMDQIVEFDQELNNRLSSYDLEVSIDEGARDTTPEDHAFSAQYLHQRGVDFNSLAPKFPGEFQKGIEYMGDADNLAESMKIHGELARMIGGYRLSLHSGSDKFSVYPVFSALTESNFHIKTSGTSWLEAVRLIASVDRELFEHLYRLCLDNLVESKKSYHVYITPEHFQRNLPEDIMDFFNKNEVRQLFHISYGVLLDDCKERIYKVLTDNEARHYEFVTAHIDRHLRLL